MESMASKVEVYVEQNPRDQVVKEKRKRNGVKKSRDGCLTCRIRHVKCDETPGACRRCTSTGRKCDFIPSSDALICSSASSPAPWHCATVQRSKVSTITISSITGAQTKRRPAIQAKPSRQLTPAALIPRHSSFPDSDARPFDYFRRVCMPSLQGSFYDTFWSTTIFQLAHTEPAILCTVNALALLHRSIILPDKCRNGKEEVDGMYVKALQGVNRELMERKGDGRVVALVSSLLFAMFEALRKENLVALKHLVSGLAVLREYSSTHVLRGIVAEISKVFVRFNTHAASLASFYAPTDAATPVLPLKFANVIEAREALESIVMEMQRSLAVYKNTDRTLPYSSLPAKTQTVVSSISSLLAQWLEKVKQMPFQREHTAAVDMMYIQHHSATIHLGVFFYRDHLAYDAYMPQFRDIVKRAMAALDKEEVVGRIRLTLDSGVIPGLFLTATKCRNPSLRREAIGLLDRSGQESAWDGDAMAAVSRLVVRLEEEGMEDDFVEEKRRLRELNFANGRREATLLCVRRDGEKEEILVGQTWWGTDGGRPDHIEVRGEDFERPSTKLWEGTRSWRRLVLGRAPVWDWDFHTA